MLKALDHASLACGRRCSIKLIDASDLDEITQKDDPVKYHEAWQALCGAEYVER
jgi:CTP synthase